VLAYLARYTHRIAISDARLVGLDGERVALRCRDYRDGARHKTVWLDGVELVRRFLLHVLPKGFMRIRHYGLLANRCRVECLATARAAIARAVEPPIVEAAARSTPWSRPAQPTTCPHCGRTPLTTVHHPPPTRLRSG
jgi:hypothetical protein